MMPNVFGIGPLTADIIGIAGMLCIVGAYAYTNFAPRVDALVFNGVNLAGAALLAVSLTVHFNLASMILEAVWATIALLGIARALRQRSGAR